MVLRPAAVDCNFVNLEAVVGKSLSVSDIQGHLRQLQEKYKDLTAEERYSLSSAIEAMQILKSLGPGIKKGLAQARQFALAKAR